MMSIALPSQGTTAAHGSTEPHPLSDRTGISNLFLYDFGNKEHYQLTNVVGAINAIAEYSPAITWARGADVMAFVYYEKGDHTVWRLSNPRSLKKQPFRDNTTLVATNSGGAASPTPGTAVDPATVNATTGNTTIGTGAGQTAPVQPGSHRARRFSPPR